jgi:prophage regulatory protein
MCSLIGKFTLFDPKRSKAEPIFGQANITYVQVSPDKICIQINTQERQTQPFTYLRWDSVSASRHRNIFMKTQNNFQPLLLNVNQVADLLGCHRNTIWNRVKHGQIPEPKKFGGKTVWQRTDIENFVEALCS